MEPGSYSRGGFRVIFPFWERHGCRSLESVLHGPLVGHWFSRRKIQGEKMLTSVSLWGGNTESCAHHSIPLLLFLPRPPQWQVLGRKQILVFFVVYFTSLGRRGRLDRRTRLTFWWRNKRCGELGSGAFAGGNVSASESRGGGGECEQPEFPEITQKNIWHNWWKEGVLLLNEGWLAAR